MGRRVVDAEGAVALVTGSSGFRSHQYCYRGSPVVFQERQQRDSSGTSSFRQSFSMTQFITSEAKIPILRPFVEDWLGRNILTKSRLPPRLFLSCLFYVKKKKKKKKS